MREEWVRGERILDSLLLARMRDENDLSYSLEDLLLSKHNVPPWKDKTEPYNWIKERNENNRLVRRRRVDARRWPPSLRKDRCARDAWAARVLVEDLYDKRQASLVEYTHKTAMVLERMRLAGAAVDMEKFDALDRDLGLNVHEYRDKLVKLAASVAVGGTKVGSSVGSAGAGVFSPTNDNHIRHLLFDVLGLASLGKTKTGQDRVDKTVLKQLAASDPSGFVEQLLAYNKFDKLYTVNVSGVRKLIDLPTPPVLCSMDVRGLRADVGSVGEWNDLLGLLSFRINPLGARTGRRSSTAPNSQNWPEAVKGIVRSRWAAGRILNADYQKLEVRLIAWVAGDDKLLAYFSGEGRGYRDVARELLGYDVVDQSPEYRAVKSIVLGVHYNMQTDKMARNLWDLYDEKAKAYPCRFSADYDEHWNQTDKLRKLYLRKFAGVGRYMGEREAYWLRTGTSVSYTGRVRHLPVPDRGEKGYGHALNQAINFPIQSLASDVTASALIDFEAALLADVGLDYRQYLQLLIETRKKFLDNGPKAWYNVPISLIFNEVHDALVVDLHPDRLKRDQEILVEAMRSVKSLRRLAPGFDHTILGADLKVDTHWKSK